jgi:4'-phosphopantetheinyl transferase
MAAIELPAGAVHVWHADLSSVDSAVAGLLSEVELTRAGRFPRAADGRLWARGRGLLRALLGRYLQEDPRTVRIEPDAHGKPQLLEDPGDLRAPSGSGSAASPAVHFNLSHSGEIAVYALTAAGPVGVDVEVARRPVDALALAGRAFGADVAKRLGALDPHSQQREFLSAWVRHEAALKLLGTGIGGGPPAQTPPWIADLEIGPGAAAAVALDAEPSELRCRRWL